MTPPSPHTRRTGAADESPRYAGTTGGTPHHVDAAISSAHNARTTDSSPRNAGTPRNADTPSRPAAARRPARTPAPRARYAGIDGIKGLALIGIIVYHLNASVLPGGFVGVDVFLTVSGFLVGTSLLRTLARYGNINLRAYYLRRALRILPALLLMVPLATIIASLVNKDLLVHVLPQVLSGITCTYNWFAILSNASYFDAMNPQLFQHLWFIAVLAQCYLLAPALVLALWRRIPAHTSILVLVALAAASFVAMGLLYDPTAPTRVYEGTDTHVGGFLLGLSTAWALQQLHLDASGWSHTSTRAKARATRPDTAPGTPTIAGLFRKHGLLIARLVAPYLAFCSLIVLVALAVLVQGEPAFRGGIAAASVASVLLLLGTVCRGSWMQGLFEIPPLACIGRNSYGLYLWHWPAWLFCSAAAGSASPAATVFRTLLATAALAFISSTLIERPIARFTSRATRTALPVSSALTARPVAPGDNIYVAHPVATNGSRAARSTSPNDPRATRALATVALVAACYVGCIVALVGAPEKTQLQTKIEAMQSAQEAELQQVDAGQNAATLADTQPATTSQPATTGAAAPEPQQAATTFPSGSDISVVGDSVTLFSTGALKDQFPGIAIDAKSSRTIKDGLEILKSLVSTGGLRPWLVLSLATNSFLTADDLDQVRATIGDDTKLLLVGAHGPQNKYPRYPEMNELLRTYAQQHRQNTIYVDWDAAISAHPDLVYEDGVHPHEEEGGAVYSQAIHDAIDRWLREQNAPTTGNATNEQAETADTDAATTDAGTARTAGTGTAA